MGKSRRAKNSTSPPAEDPQALKKRKTPFLSLHEKARDPVTWRREVEKYITHDDLKELVEPGCNERTLYALLYVYSARRIDPARHIKARREFSNKLRAHLREISDGSKKMFEGYRGLKQCLPAPLARGVVRKLEEVYRRDPLDVILETSAVVMPLTDRDCALSLKKLGAFGELLSDFCMDVQHLPTPKSLASDDYFLVVLCEYVRITTLELHYAAIANLLNAAWLAHGMGPGWTAATLETQLSRAGWPEWATNEALALYLRHKHKLSRNGRKKSIS